MYRFFRRNFKSHQDRRRKGSKAMNRNTILWNKCYATIVFPKVDNQIWFYTLRSVRTFDNIFSSMKDNNYATKF